MRAPFFWHPGICTYFSLRDFSRLLILLVLHELTVIFVNWLWYLCTHGRACQIAPFFSTARYMIGPRFSTKSIWMAQFFWIPYEGPIFLTSWYMHIFFAQRFFEAAYPLGITWIDCDICVTTSKNGYKKNQRAVYEEVNILDDQVYEWVRFSKARYMNRVGFEILARTPVPKLPLSYAPHPPPHTHTPTPFKSLKVATRRGVRLFSSKILV